MRSYSAFEAADLDGPFLSSTIFIVAANVNSLNSLSKSNPGISAATMLIVALATLPNFLVIKKNAKSLLVFPFDLKYK